MVTLITLVENYLKVILNNNVCADCADIICNYYFDSEEVYNARKSIDQNLYVFNPDAQVTNINPTNSFYDIKKALYNVSLINGGCYLNSNLYDKTKIFLSYHPEKNDSGYETYEYANSVIFFCGYAELNEKGKRVNFCFVLQYYYYIKTYSQSYTTEQKIKENDVHYFNMNYYSDCSEEKINHKITSMFFNNKCKNINPNINMCVCCNFAITNHNDCASCCCIDAYRTISYLKNITVENFDKFTYFNNKDMYSEIERYFYSIGIKPNHESKIDLEKSIKYMY